MGNHKKSEFFLDTIMKFQCMATDGPAQTGILTFKGEKIKTPTIVFPAIPEYFPPSYADSYIQLISEDRKNLKKPCFQIGQSLFFHQQPHSDKSDIQNHILIPKALPHPVQKDLYQYFKQNEKKMMILPADETMLNTIVNPSKYLLYIISYAKQLFNDPKRFVSYITKLRQLIGYDSLIYTPVIANPLTLAFLVYIGCDVFDATNAILNTSHHQFFLPNSIHNVNDITENPCLCPICSQNKKSPSSFSFDQLVQHNYNIMNQELIIIRNAIEHHHLRDHVEQKIRSSPHLVTLLRYLDNSRYSYLEQRCLVSMPESYKLLSTSRETAHRPEISRFKQRIETRYHKPYDKNILLLLPCSSRKPYSFSKSHKLFHQAISKVPTKSVIHELIITSPLGLVPRELELTYPASSYDISVTGTWFADEKQMIQTQLKSYLKNNQYEAIVSHLPESLIYPIKTFENRWYQTQINEKATSKKSLNRLTKTLYQLTQEKTYKNISKTDRKMHQVYAIASYQFGKEIADELLRNCVIKGKYPLLKIINNKGKQLGMIPKKRGLISLTANGGKKIYHLNEYVVKIDTGFKVKGSILAPGILSSDTAIRRGDDVLIIQGDLFLGVGVALMNGNEMMSRSFGEAVNMRHKIK